MSNPTMVTPKRRGILARLWLTTWRGRFSWVVGLLLFALVTCWVLVRMTPPWYRPLDPDDQGVIDAAGRGQTLVLFDLRNAFERVPLGEQRWSISQDEANGYAAVATAPPLTDDGRGRLAPDAARNPVTDPFLLFEPGEITICARVTKLPGRTAQGGVGSVTFAVGIVAGKGGVDGGGDPMGLVRVKKVWLGNLPVPESMVESRVRAASGMIVEAVLEFARIRFGVKEMDKWEPVLRDTTEKICTGQPFALRYKVDRKEFVIKELNIEHGRLTVVLAPIKVATATSQTLPQMVAPPTQLQTPLQTLPHLVPQPQTQP